MKDCTILVNSCDSYEDLWYPFFKLLFENWKDYDCPVVLNTETKEFHFDGINIQNYHFFTSSNVHLGERFIKYLGAVQTEFVLIVLDDFFIREPVDTKRLEKCIQWMKRDEKIATFSLNPVHDINNITSTEYCGFSLRPKKGKYRFNLQLGLWRTKDLISYVHANESPWEWEEYGNIRSFILDKDFYCAAENSKPIINYGYRPIGQWGVVQGKWCINDVEPLFSSHGIKIDYSIRGEYKKEQYDKSFLSKLKRSPSSFVHLLDKYSHQGKEYLFNLYHLLFK